MNLYELLLLIATIAFVIGVVILRRILGLVLPHTRVQVLPLQQLPADFAGLLAEHAPVLAALGFGPPVALLLEHDPADAPLLSHCVLFRHAGGELLMLGPPCNAARPHQPLVALFGALADGRIACSQWFDVAAAQLASAAVPCRVGGEPDLAGFCAGHQAWRSGLGAPLLPVDDTPEALAALFQRLGELQRQQALASGKLVFDRVGRSVPSWTCALRMMYAAFTGPKPPNLLRAIPVTRLDWLAALNERMQLLAPDSARQWTLFGFSVVLFVLLGAVFWSLQFALILLLVVGIHEAGHFLAMRAFGYRNLQMLALPLVGGVAIGHEDRPRAFSRAWMSLAGPLPGMLIGAVLLALAWHLPWLGGRPGWLLQAGLIFLAVNYLNLLPIPPLDGGHVVQALLPRRFALAEGWFLLLACSAGALAAWYFDLTLLLAVFVLQLLGVPALFRHARLLQHFAGKAAPPPDLPRPERLHAVLLEIERLAGPSALALPRIQAAEGVLRSLDMQPMSRLQQAVVGAVLVGMLALPAGVAGWWWWDKGVLPGSRSHAQVEEMEQWHAGLQAEADRLDTAALVRALAQEAVAAAALPAVQGAGALQLQEAEQRLGMALPAELRELYAISAAGLPQQEIVPLAGLGRLRDADRDWRGWFGDHASIELLAADDHAPDEVVPVAELGDALLLNEFADALELMLYQPAAPARPARWLLIEYAELGSVYPPPWLRERLAEFWMHQQMTRRLARLREG